VRIRKLPYREGTWFAVPLADGTFATGVVARLNGTGLTFCHFFGPRRIEMATIEAVERLQSEQAILREKVGDLGLIRHEWPIIGTSSQWVRSEWPLPTFISQDGITGQMLEFVYDDNLKIVEQRAYGGTGPIEPLPEGVAGSGYVEDVLSDLLAAR